MRRDPESLDFSGLFVLDLANNHQGDIDHASAIIEQCAEIVHKHGVRAAFKFQLRHLDTFIHPEYRNRADLKHIPRFLSTALSLEDYGDLAGRVREAGLTTMATPFDEESVDVVEELDIEVIKVASCSASDWPLLERVAEVKRPTIISTGGLKMSEIDKLVSFFDFKEVPFGLMHCVAIYPTPTSQLRLNQIDLLHQRFPHLPIGWSTHEDPHDTAPVQIAVAKGAVMFERHVGLTTDKYQLNAYSSTPDQLDRWITASREALKACGSEERAPAPPEETEALASLMRGVWVRQAVMANQTLDRSKVFFAMPLQEGQLTSGQWSPNQLADRDYRPYEPVNEQIADHAPNQDERIYGIMLQVSGLLNLARIIVGEDNPIELSHHYGLDRFREFGCVLIDCINRDYCKKLVVMLPRQQHPYHFHKRKEETFQLLHGDLHVEVEGVAHSLEPGDTLLIPRDQWHKFDTLDGAIFEEVSTTAYADDSFYEDKIIAGQARNNRKTSTVLPSWRTAVRHHFVEGT